MSKRIQVRPRQIGSEIRHPFNKRHHRNVAERQHLACEIDPVYQLCRRSFEGNPARTDLSSSADNFSVTGLLSLFQLET